MLNFNLQHYKYFREWVKVLQLLSIEAIQNFLYRKFYFQCILITIFYTGNFTFSAFWSQFFIQEILLSVHSDHQKNHIFGLLPKVYLNVRLRMNSFKASRNIDIFENDCTQRVLNRRNKEKSKYEEEDLKALCQKWDLYTSI